MKENCHFKCHPGVLSCSKPCALCLPHPSEAREASPGVNLVDYGSDSPSPHTRPGSAIAFEAYLVGARLYRPVQFTRWSFPDCGDRQSSDLTKSPAVIKLVW